VYPVAGSDKFVWIKREDLRVILGLMSEVNLVLDDLAPDPDGRIICRISRIDPVAH
jgi:hypothetical protein